MCELRPPPLSKSPDSAVISTVQSLTAKQTEDVMSKQFSEAGEGLLGTDGSDNLVRAIYYGVIMSIGLMLAMAVYFAR
jgi:hypothetical protein